MCKAPFTTLRSTDRATDRRRGRRVVGALATVVALAVTACGTPGPDATGATRPAGTAAYGCTGPATATAAGAIAPMSPAPTAALPVRYTDVTGQAVTVTDTSRILALDSYGTLATTVYALGLGDRLVGRDVSTGIADLQHLPLVTHNGHELNGEAILDLDPSVILTDYSIGPLEVQLQLRDAGIPVVIMSDQRSTEQIGPQIQAVADALGVSAAGRTLANRVEQDTKVAIEAVATRAAAAGPTRPRVVFLYVRGGAGVYYWFGKGSGADDLITALGGVDVATEVGLEGSKPLNAEGLVRADPDLYLVMSQGLASVGGVAGLQEIPGVADTNAGRTSCVVDMRDDQILSFGPQFPVTLAALADAVYGPTPTVR